jgi:hypothetical protein
VAGGVDSNDAVLRNRRRLDDDFQRMLDVRRDDGARAARQRARDPARQQSGHEKDTWFDNKWSGWPDSNRRPPDPQS